MRHFRRQVSWLSALRLRPPSRFPSGIKAFGLPITVAGAASDWGAMPVTVFPFYPLAGHRPALDTGRGEASSTGIEPQQPSAKEAERVGGSDRARHGHHGADNGQILDLRRLTGDLDCEGAGDGANAYLHQKHATDIGQ